jgi:hypothetical protein
MFLLTRRLPWPIRIVLGLAVAGAAAFFGTHHGTSHTWMEGKLRDQIDAQIAPRTVSAIHCDVASPSATCHFTISGVTFVQHFRLNGNTWRPSDQPARA